MPSEPTARPIARAFAVGIGYSTMIEPFRLIFAILLALYSVNHRFPSGPATMPNGCEFAVGSVNSLNVAVVSGLVVDQQ